MSWLPKLTGALTIVGLVAYGIGRGIGDALAHRLSHPR